MIIGVLTIELHLPMLNSLKAKRFVLKSAIERLRQKFNVSVGEVDCHDLWQRAVLGVAIVGREKRYCNEVLDKITDFFESLHEVNIIDHAIEFI